MPMIGSVTTPRARKEHECWWCGEKIRVGEQYSRWLWKESEDVEAIKVHPECNEAWAGSSDVEDGVPFGEFSRGCECQSGFCSCDKPALR